ncbi:MAG TPA: tol-pal system protein YbgF [Oceanospirillales bacterium]|nr:tol-pal system protein YbgF [Oceanospirillales bacterium]|tara:strand:+ start:97 stop:921 length:825 start_codon:yes stop_codon:yes gene_type:complete
MKYTLLSLALTISMVSAAEDGWVAVGQAPSAKPAVQSNATTQSDASPQATASTTSNTSIKPSASVQQSSFPVAGQPASLQVELLSMVETMQQEIAELRGTVEEQNHKIEILQKQQQQRYLDLDKRMSELMQNPVSKPVESTVEGVLPADDLYAKAMSLIKKKDFSSALVQLDQFAKTYPNHKLAANAFYWSGEVQLAEGNYELAINQFTQVIESHGDHSKAADSHYKLAVAHDRNGETEKAKQILNTVIKLYADKSDSVVRLAERYLKRLNSAG